MNSASIEIVTAIYVPDLRFPDRCHPTVNRDAVFDTRFFPRIAVSTRNSPVGPFASQFMYTPPEIQFA
jgi:hypothetical protein